jgi:hypothetical protein
MKVSLCYHRAVYMSVIPLLLTFECLMKVGMYIMAREPISTAYLINPSNQSVCLNMYPAIVARQWLGKNVTAATNTHATIEELLVASFSMWAVSYRGKVGYSLLPELLVCFFILLSLFFV